MTRYDVWSPRPANNPADLDQLRARLRSLGADGVTLQWTAPKEGGVTELWRTDALARTPRPLRPHLSPPRIPRTLRVIMNTNPPSSSSSLEALRW